jgi:hypothetical protein
VEESIDHVARALGRLLEQYKGQPNLAALITSYVEGTQDAEQNLFELLLVNLDDAEGDNLDLLGRLVGEARDGKDDDGYRIYLRARIKLNLMSGTTEEILELFDLLLDDPYVFELSQYQPAAFVLDVSGDAIADDIATRLAQILNEAKAAGVRADLVYSSVADADTFTFTEDDDSEASSPMGFAEDDGSDGGAFADVPSV